MTIVDSFATGTIFFSGEKESLSDLFNEAGIENSVGQWALRLFLPVARFEIAWVGNITPDAPYEMEVDGYGIPVDTVDAWCQAVAKCLRLNGIRFELTHFTAEGEEIMTFEG